MTFINDADLLKIEEAVKKVELKTRGEIVTMVTQSSDDYDYIRYFWAAIFALLGPAPLLILHLVPDPNSLLIIQIISFCALTYLLDFSFIKMKLVPKSITRRRASRFAREQFFTQNVHNTNERAGILIFVSVAERYVEIIADKGISDKIEKREWQDIIDHFVSDMKSQRIGDGFITAITSCGDKLAAHFPIKEGDKNELPNRLIIL